MIHPSPSPATTPSRCISGTEHEDPALSSKRFSAQHKEDQLSQLDLKRPGAPPASRARLDPFSASHLEKRCARGSRPTDSAMLHSLITPSSLPDLQDFRVEQPLSSGSCKMQRSGASDAPVYSWPPPIPTLGAGRLYGSPASLYSSAEEKSTCGAFLESVSTWHALDSFQAESPTMIKPIRTTERKSENVLQPIRSRTNSMPSVRQPPGELWQLGPGPTAAVHEPVDAADPLVCLTPSGLPSRRPELRRSASVSEQLPHGSVSLSLAPGSQPLMTCEHSKAVPPIGAERSRAEVASFKPHIRNSPLTGASDPSQSPWCSLPRLARPGATWTDEVYSMNTRFLGKVQTEACYARMSKEDLERLLRHAVRNKHAPKIISPLSPLRTTTPACDLSADPAYRLRMPSQSNNPSPRYSKCPPRRARTVCDGYQSFNWDTTCTHCQACKRDTMCKRLLAFRYRQHQTHHVQRHRLLHAHPVRGANASVVDDDRMVLADRIREVFAYDMDEEEKSLWEEVAAVTGGGPLPFLRVGVSCAATAHRRAVCDRSDDGTRDDYLEMPDEVLASESASLFRDMHVY